MSNDQAVEQDEETSGEKTEPLDKWLLALKEDLASWISRLLKMDITVDTFTTVLETGVVLCKLANAIQNTGEKFFTSNRKSKVVFPRVGVKFKDRGALQGSFIARDNVCNFIRWCRDVGVPDVIMFETEDLVSNKNEKAVLLTLLEVARRVFKVGVDPPELVRLENEIDKELQNEPEQRKAEPILTVLKKKHKSHSLDDLVSSIVNYHVHFNGFHLLVFKGFTACYLALDFYFILIFLAKLVNIILISLQSWMNDFYCVFEVV